MFGLGDNNDQRFRNLVTIHAYATDKEVVQAAPFLLVVGVVLVLILYLYGG
jgi:hypothetical protein